MSDRERRRPAATRTRRAAPAATRRGRSPVTPQRTTAARTSADGTAVYAYAVVDGRPAARLVSTLAAIPDAARPRVLDLGDDRSLIVSDVPQDRYNTETIESRLHDLDWVALCGTAHHAVADALAADLVVLPLRLFTIFSSEGNAIAALRRARARIGKALGRVRGRKEWVLRIGRPDPARVQPASSKRLPPASQSGTSFLRGKADARREQAERAARAHADAARVFALLAKVADEAETRPTPQAANLLLDAAFLVGTRRTATFRRTLANAAPGLLRDGCAVSLTGPWPPYSFATLE
jgi:hypothetical protein